MENELITLDPSWTEAVHSIFAAHSKNLAVPNLYTTSSLLFLNRTNYGLLYSKRLIAASISCPFSHDKCSIFLFLFAVSKKDIGKGYGKALFGYCKEQFAREGFKEVVLRVLAKNGRAKDFWIENGFVQISIPDSIKSEEYPELLMKCKIK